MTPRRWPVMLTVAVGLLAGCGSSRPVVGTTGDLVDEPGPPPHPRPAQVLDAAVVHFDPDGTDALASAPPLGRIIDAAGLDEFARRYVDGEPSFGTAAREALDNGAVLIGGRISSSCTPAERPLLVLFDGDVDIVAAGLPKDDPDLACVRAIDSIALVAIDPADLPDGVTVQGT